MEVPKTGSKWVDEDGDSLEVREIHYGMSGIFVFYSYNLKDQPYSTTLEEFLKNFKAV